MSDKLYIAAAIFLLGAALGGCTHKVISDRKIAVIEKNAAEERSVVALALAKEEAKNRDLQQRWDATAQIERDEFDAQLQDTRGQLDTAVRRLHDSQASTRAALRSAKDAPASCGAFSAPPSRLSPADAELALRLAAEANAVVIERNLCVQQYNEVRNAQNAK